MQDDVVLRKGSPVSASKLNSFKKLSITRETLSKLQNSVLSPVRDTKVHCIHK